MEPRSLVTFVERAGPDAGAALERLRARLAAAGTASRLLASRDEADLHLLVIEGDPPLADEEVAGARVWRFGAAGAGREAGPRHGDRGGASAEGDGPR
jgi:hypothetical protein